jgi:hypothetical protein
MRCSLNISVLANDSPLFRSQFSPFPGGESNPIVRMRPLSLKGHDRALTRVRLNREGDLLFSSAKDKSPCVWYVENGERLGTFDVSAFPPGRAARVGPG